MVGCILRHNCHVLYNLSEDSDFSDHALMVTLDEKLNPIGIGIEG